MSDMNECRRRLPIWSLFQALNLREADKVAAWGGSPARCMILSPFRDEKTPSFSVAFRDGVGLWKDFGTGESGDEIKLIEQAKGVSTKDAMRIYCELSGARWDEDGEGKPRKREKKFVPKKEAAPKKEGGELAKRLEGVEVPKKEKASGGSGFGRIVEEYSYLDEKGELVHQTLRMEPKAFRQRRPARKGDDEEARRKGWVWSLTDSKVVPYRLPEILKADPIEPIFLVEGEKDVENLERLSREGFPVLATCLPMGAGKWRAEFAKWFRGRWVVVIPDHDKPGLEGAEVVARELVEVADRVGVLYLDDLGNRHGAELGARVRPGDDVSDWLEKGWEKEVSVEEQYDVLMKAADRAGVEDLKLFAGCVCEGRFGQKIDQDRFARMFVRVYNMIFVGDSFWVWDPEAGLWERKREKTWIEREVRRRVREAGLGDTVNGAFLSSQVKLLRAERVLFPEELNAHPPGTFAVRNGLLNVAKGWLLPHRSGRFTTVQIPHRYDPAEECPKWLEWLGERQEDQETRDQIQEIFGYCLATHINYHRFFFFYGDGGTGKSTCVDVLEWLVGEENKVAVELTELDNPFMRSQLVGKSLALCKELNRDSLKHVGLIKAIVSGDPISVDVKYQEGFDFRPKCRVVMESNVLPFSSDSTDGFARRFVQVSFDKAIEQNEMDFNFKDRFKEELPGILNWALAGFRRLVERGRFVHTQRSQQATDDFKKHRAQVESFLKSGVVMEFPLHENGERTRLCVWMEDVFESYQEWAAREDVVPFYKEKSAFARELFTKKPDWRERKRREWVNATEGIRDSRIYGINLKEVES